MSSDLAQDRRHIATLHCNSCVYKQHSHDQEDIHTDIILHELAPDHTTAKEEGDSVQGGGHHTLMMIYKILI